MNSTTRISYATRRYVRFTCPALACLLCLLLVDCSRHEGLEKHLFRVCVLSDFMPLSNQTPAPHNDFQGLYLDLAGLMAERMGKTMESYFPMVAFYKRPVRAGLLADHCDAHFGLPRDRGDWYIRGSVLLTRPFTSIGYSVVAQRSQPVKNLEDLRGMTVGVQAGSPPQFALTEVEGVEMRTFLSAGQAMEALHEGRIDAAFVWGPVAGYLNKFVYENSYRVVPSGFSWPVAIGVRADNTLLKERLDSLIDELEDDIRQLRARYGLPYGELIPVDPPEDEVAEGSGTPLPAYEADPADVKKGRSLFNATLGCAHCHGPNAQAVKDKVDLRLLHRRHRNMAQRVFRETVLHGRPGTEMPEWRETLSGHEEWIDLLQSYIFSIQTE